MIERVRVYKLKCDSCGKHLENEKAETILCDNLEPLQFQAALEGWQRDLIYGEWKCNVCNMPDKINSLKNKYSPENKK